MTRSFDEIFSTIPDELKEVSYAVGATRLETTLSVTLRQAIPGISTGIILAFGRAIGDAASILFTAGYTDKVPQSLLEPAASLPLAIFFQFGTPFKAVQERAYASAVILLLIILLLTTAARLLSGRSQRNLIR
jgi:phosphate transport system permease protein